MHAHKDITRCFPLLPAGHYLREGCQQREQATFNWQDKACPSSLLPPSSVCDVIAHTDAMQSDNAGWMDIDITALTYDL